MTPTPTATTDSQATGEVAEDEVAEAVRAMKTVEAVEAMEATTATEDVPEAGPTSKGATDTHRIKKSKIVIPYSVVYLYM
jgi:phage tail tape-measure protein